MAWCVVNGKLMSILIGVGGEGERSGVGDLERLTLLAVDILENYKNYKAGKLMQKSNEEK
jgi:hypothetical protein